MRPTSAIEFLILLLAVACATRPAGVPEEENTKALPVSVQKEPESKAVPLAVQRMESTGSKVKPTKRPFPDPLSGEPYGGKVVAKIDWGREATLDEIIAMAKNSEILQIEWHVMPNIIRAQAADGRVFHIRNENKGIDIRNKLIDAGVDIGKSGINFRYVF